MRSDVEPSPSAALRAFGWIGIGALAGWLVELGSPPLQRPLAMPSDARCWVADRDGDALFALDDELRVVARVPVRAPTDLAAAPGGELWVVSARERRAGGARRLIRIDAAGSLVREVELAGPVRLAPFAGGAVCCLAARDGGEAWLVQPGGRVQALPAADGARCGAWDGERLLVGGPGGLLRALGSGGEELGRTELAEPVSELAAAGGRDGWWVLAGMEGELLLRLDPALALRAAVETGLAGSGLAAEPDGDRAWVLDPRAGRLRRFGPAGLELELAEPELADASRAIALSAGEFAVATPGALLRFDRAGRPLAGQGGFDFLVDALGLSPP